MPKSQGYNKTNEVSKLHKSGKRIEPGQPKTMLSNNKMPQKLTMEQMPKRPMDSQNAKSPTMQWDYSVGGFKAVK